MEQMRELAKDSDVDIGQQPPPARGILNQVRILQQHYSIVGGSRILIDLLNEYDALSRLLVEAVTPLKAAFGERLLQIRVQRSEFDSLVKVAVQLPIDFAQPETALRCFDDKWWLENCHRSSGALVFDYEIQDGV